MDTVWTGNWSCCYDDGGELEICSFNFDGGEQEADADVLTYDGGEQKTYAVFLLW